MYNYHTPLLKLYTSFENWGAPQCGLSPHCRRVGGLWEDETTWGSWRISPGPIADLLITYCHLTPVGPYLLLFEKNLSLKKKWEQYLHSWLTDNTVHLPCWQSLVIQLGGNGEGDPGPYQLHECSLPAYFPTPLTFYSHVPFRSLDCRSPPFTTRHKSLFLPWSQSIFLASSPAFQPLPNSIYERGFKPYGKCLQFTICSPLFP